MKDKKKNDEPTTDAAGRRFQKQYGEDVSHRGQPTTAGGVPTNTPFSTEYLQQENVAGMDKRPEQWRDTKNLEGFSSWKKS